MSKDTKDFILALSWVALAISSIMGLLFGCMDGKHNRCEYKSVATLHPAYYVGCQLFKPRFK